MKIIKNLLELQSNLKKMENISLIPTMGNLHEGHMSLIEEAKKLSKNIILTIFINPAQFDSKEDLDSYPRTLKQDINLLKDSGVSILFNPSIQDIYPEKPSLSYNMPSISNELCGKSRKDHFKGVIIILDKLFNLIMPSFAIFGKKDYQQLHLVKKFVIDSNLPINIIDTPIIRNKNNLALSSRNSLIDDKNFNKAPYLYEQLKICAERVINGENFYNSELLSKKELIKSGWRIDYFEIRRQFDLSKPSYNDLSLVVLGAAFLGKIRLIDNIEFCIPRTN